MYMQKKGTGRSSLSTMEYGQTVGLFDPNQPNCSARLGLLQCGLGVFMITIGSVVSYI